MFYQRIFSLVILIVFIARSRNFALAEIGLPMIQISHDDVDNEYPEMQEQVHLEDFFWTGSGDGPPDYLKKVHTGISKGKEVIVKTETVVATVYVEGNNEVDIPICLDCFPDDGGGGGGIRFDGSAAGGLPLNFSSNDRRYWLLTVLSGFHTQKDNPMLEEKLARLYRIAFTRQQSKHLGIGNEVQQNFENLLHRGRERDETTTESENDENKRRKRILEEEQRISSSDEEESLSSTTATTSSNDESMTTYPTLYESLFTSELNRTNSELHLRYSPAVGVAPPPPSLAHSQTSAAMLNNRAAVPILSDDHVRVVIHNITQITEDDIQNGVITNVYDEDINEKIDERPIANQTELIYSVFVNGRPVLAFTAANDMKLVGENEVADVMGKAIFMKAEPYLREPQATPLAPATRSGTIEFFASIQENPILVIVTSISLLLLLILLVALLLMGRTRHRERLAKEKRVSSRNELLTGGQSPISTVAAINKTERTTTTSRDVGIQNFSFENENFNGRTSHVTYPDVQVVTGSRRDSITSFDNTSDSSIYCPINPPDTDVQRMLDEKAATLFDKRNRQHQYDRAEGQEAIYTTVISEKKRNKLTTKHKNKRRYLSENRVGSIEEGAGVHYHRRHHQHNSSTEEATDSNESLPDALRPNYDNYERHEAYNPHNNYHRNKLLQNGLFSDKVYDGYPTTEVINRKIIQALQPSEKSSENGSIGSFLSMASVKSFPKSTHPEPLNRVLDPVFVTYYDNVDEPQLLPPHPPAKAARKHLPARNSTKTIGQLPEPKAPVKSVHIASQSDNPDPSVIGPIVWEIHKKQMAATTSDNDDDPGFSPARDPAATRNHYEGLLEGAIQMYSSQDDLLAPLPTRDFINNRKQTKRENRGKSAELTNSKDIPKEYIYSGGVRPSTAHLGRIPKSNHSTEPPSPTTGAWGSSSSRIYSPTIRPFSAGPFPNPPNIDNAQLHTPSTINREETLAAPIIEAIQNELKKFKQQHYLEKK